MADAPTLVAVEEAQRIVRACVRPLPTVTVDLEEARGMTLAEDICCDTDVPIFDRAMRDGYAVRSADVARAPVELQVVGEVTAGGAAPAEVGAGEVVWINTGAPLPSGADAVVKVEDTAPGPDGRSIMVKSPHEAEQHVSRRGEYASGGERVLQAGTPMGPLQMAVAATAGAARLTVYARPRVSVLVTGDEVVDVTARPAGRLTALPKAG